MVSPQRSSLTVMGGPMARQRFELPTAAGEYIVGSDPTCDVCIPLPGVHSRHAAVRIDSAGAVAVDLGSPRGVFVNDDRVSREHSLLDGDMLWLGSPTEADSVMLQCRIGAIAAPLRDEFFVGEGAGDAAPSPPAARSAPTPSAAAPAPPSTGVATMPVPEEAFFVGEAAPPAQPDTPGPDETWGLTPPPPVSVPEEAFFVDEVPAVAPPAPPAVDDFFVAEVPPAETARAVPSKSAAPAPEVGPQTPAPPAPPPKPAGAPAAPQAIRGGPGGAPAVAASPTAPGGLRGAPAPAAGARAAVAPSAPAARAPLQPTARPPAAPARPRPPAVPARTPVARAAGSPRARSPQRASRGRGPAMGLAIAAVVLLAAGGVVAAMFFVGRPRVASIDPGRARVGDTVVLTGERFGETPGSNVVRFGKQDAQVLSAGSGRLETRIPDLGIPPGQEATVDVRVRVGRKQSAAVSIVVREAPRVRGLSPEVALPGEDVVIAGGGWVTTGVEVTFGGVGAQVLDVAPNYVRARVPALGLPAGSLVPVVVGSGQDRSAPATLILGRLPVITSIQPKSASFGEVVRLRGRGLRPSPGEHAVRIGGVLALVVGVSEGAVDVMVPTEAPAGEVPVEVRVQGYPEPGTAALVVNPPADPVDLRFAAEPYVDGSGRVRAAITSGLGPAFVLSASAGRSAAERAAEAVGRLNAAATALKAAGEAGLEVRTAGATSAIALTGAREAVLEVTDEDAAAYQAEAAALRLRAPRVTRGRLAAWWAALLNDLVLALGRVERPRQAAALAPEGRALGELFDLATRGGAPGIMRSGIAAARPALRDSLRSLGLRVPATVAEPPGRVSVLVDLDKMRS